MTSIGPKHNYTFLVGVTSIFWENLEKELVVSIFHLVFFLILATLISFVNAYLWNIPQELEDTSKFLPVLWQNLCTSDLPLQMLASKFKLWYAQSGRTSSNHLYFFSVYVIVKHMVYFFSLFSLNLVLWCQIMNKIWHVAQIYSNYIS